MAALLLPSDVGGVTTETVGLFDVSARVLADWFAARPRLRVSMPGWQTLEDASRDLAPSEALTRRGFVPLGAWTLLLTNGPLGTDVGVLPSHATRSLGCVSIRAVWADNGHHRYPAVILEVFTPEGEGPLKERRYLAAANDGGRWIFEQSGEPFGFEHVESYSARRVSDRFTAAMLHQYLRELGVPPDASPDWSAALVVAG